MDNNIQSVNSQPPIKPYIPPETQTINTKKGLIIGVAVGFVFIAAIVLVLVLLVFPSSGSRADAIELSPILYMEDDEVYLAVGTRTVELEGAAIIDGDYENYVNSQISYDKRYFIYLADVDEETGAGDLMMIDLKGDFKPNVIEEEVCTAMMSAYGDYILFFKNVENGAGTLYYAKLSGEAKEVADDVLTVKYKISLDGRNYSYLVMADDNTNELYACLDGAEIEKVREISRDKGEDVSVIRVTNSGKLIYNYIESDGDADEEDKKLYVYKDGNEEKIGNNAYIEFIFDSEYEQVLYSDEDSLYYKAMGENKDRITKDFYSIVYCRDFVFSSYQYSRTFDLDTHFVFTENKDEESNYPEEVCLYEMRIGTDPIKITEADPWTYVLTNDLEWLFFKRNEELCLTYKDGKEWSDRIEISEFSKQAGFDESDQYLYYIELSDKYDDSGDLYRYKLTKREHEPELLQYDVVGYYFYNGTVITINSDDEIYVVYSKDDKKLLFDEELVDWYRAPNGIYVYTEANDYDIYYITFDGEEEEICLDASELLSIGYGITHNFASDVPEDIIDDLSKVYEDVKYVQDVLNGKETPEDVDMYKQLDVHMADLEDLMDRSDIGTEALEMIDSFYQGLVQVDNYFDSDYGSDEEQQALDSMNSYFDKARAMFELVIGESTVDPLY